MWGDETGVGITIARGQGKELQQLAVVETATRVRNGPSTATSAMDLTTPSRRLCCCVCYYLHEKWRAMTALFVQSVFPVGRFHSSRFVAEQHSLPPNLAPPLLVFSVEVQDDIPYVSVGSSTNCVFGGVPSIPCDDGRDVVVGTISW